MKISSVSLLVFLVFALNLAGCSSNKSNPLTPVNNGNGLDLPFVEPDKTPSDHQLLSTFTATFDIESLSSTVQPNRTLNAHHNYTGMIPTPIITINSWDPITETIDIDIQLHNPTWTSVYDVRLIIFTDTAGHKLLNDDNWTSHWDIPEGLIANPFKAYAKNQPNRIFTGETFHQENFQIKCPDDNFNVQFTIDASFPGNCEGPYEISNFEQGELYDRVGNKATLSVDAVELDTVVYKVFLYCPEITGGGFIPFTYHNDNKWILQLTNETGAPVGEYIGYLKATSYYSVQHDLYDEITIHVTPYIEHYKWTKSWGGTSGDIGMSVSLDHTGSAFVCGQFAETVYFNPDGEEEYTSLGSSDAYLSKFDSNGNWQWTNTWGGKDVDYAASVVLDDSGNAYVVGFFRDTVDFNPDGGDLHTSNGMGDASLSKFNSDGNWQWTKTWGGIKFDKVKSVSLDGLSNVYLTGQFFETVDFNPDGGGTHTSNGSTDGYLSKFDSDGNWQWTKTWGGLEGEDPLSVSLDKNGNAYVCGNFPGTTDFNPDGGDPHTSNGYTDAFLSKFDSSGNWQWSKTWGAFFYDNATSLALDKSDNVYITGSFFDTVDFNPDGGGTQTSIGMSDIYLSKFNSSGNWQWTKSWGGTSLDLGSSVFADISDNLYVTGRFSDSVDFNPDGGDPQASNGYYDTFLSKFDSSGIWQWSKTWGGLNIDWGYSVSADQAGNAYVTGYFFETVDFNPSGGDSHTSNGERDTFLWKGNY